MSLPDSIQAEGFVPIKQLGQGAYGVVDKVSRHGKEVALKYGMSRTLKTEITFLTALKPHPRVVRFYESGKTGDGYYWYTMEIHSGHLVDWLKRGDRRIEPKLVVRHVLEGLVYLHEQGFVHNDTHLGNFGVVWDDQKTPRVVLTDFGLVEKMLDENHEYIANPRSDFSKFLGQFDNTVYNFSERHPEMFWSELVAEVIERKSVHVLDCLLSVISSQGHLRKILEDWLPGAPFHLPSFQLNLAWKAREYNQTVAQVARTALTSKSLVVRSLAAGSLEYLCQAAGFWDNDEADPVFSPQQTILLVQETYWGREMPPQIGRLCAFDPVVFHSTEFYTFSSSVPNARLSASRQSLINSDGQEIRGVGSLFRRKTVRKAMLLFPRAPADQSLRDLAARAERLDGKISLVSVSYSSIKDAVTIQLKDGTRVFEQPTVLLLDRMTELLVQIGSDS
jgi:serine/threonine protein kinase